MKDYEHVVIWLEYFNKTLPRNKGRRLSKENCVFDPSLKELIDASNAAGLQPKETEEQVRSSQLLIFIGFIGLLIVGCVAVIVDGIMKWIWE